MIEKYSVYDKLRPWTAIERCDCQKITSLVLINLHTDNPIHCLHCKNEVDPERIMLSVKLVDGIV